MDTLLLVDDDRNVYTAVKMALGDAYEITHVNSVAEAEEILSGNTYTLILLDLMMPGADGTDLFEVLKKKKVESPVIVVSSISTAESATEAMFKGGAYYLVKPFSGRELKAVIAKVMGRKKGSDGAFCS